MMVAEIDDETSDLSLSDVFLTELELSVVMPCLNEADTIEACVGKALRALRDADIDGEVIVADNGSTDGSRELAAAAGARVVLVRRAGYGAALMGGIDAADGHYIIMGDADDSYDFLQISLFVEKLREGYELVQGCRLPSGGGTVMPGAMPFLHRWWGNPMFSYLVRGWFHAPIHDVYCGMRGFTRDLYQRLDQQCTGMEFATEMIIKSAKYGVPMAEVPITLHPDGRKSHPPHLKTFRDGWRTLRFFLMYSPKWLFLEPGKWLMLLGVLGFALGLPAAHLGPVYFGLHTLIVSGMAILCGYQSVLFAIGTKMFAINSHLTPPDDRMDRLFDRVPLERGLLVGGMSALGGAALICAAFSTWWRHGFGSLDYDVTGRWVIAGATLAAFGFQTVLSSFFISILAMTRK